MTRNVICGGIERACKHSRVSNEGSFAVFYKGNSSEIDTFQIDNTMALNFLK